MQFGCDKTQLVVFYSHRKAPIASDLSNYLQLRVCGFNIQLSSSYTYLGVDLCARRLSWKTHTARALQTCKAASARVMRIALRAAEPSFAAIRTLVLGYVVPSCMYGAMFWARNMTDDDARKLQGKFIAPLRAALRLPTTTHQLGALVMCGIPSVRAIVTSDELRFIRRLQRLETTEPQHPTAVLAKRYDSFVHGKVPRVTLSPAYQLYTATHAYTKTIPDVLDPGPGGLVHRLSPAHRVALDLPFTPRPPCLRLGADYWTTSGEVQWSTNNPRHFSKHSLNRIRGWSHQAAAHLSPPIISALGRWTTFRQWEAQHAQPAPPAPPIPSTHATSAPLTACQTTPGCAFFLARGGDDSYCHAVRRARLLCGRAYTQQTRSRFAKADAVIAPDCTNAACAAASVSGTAPVESVEHTLVHCLRYCAARQTLTSALQPIGFPQLTLSSILCATLPPGLTRSNRSLLLSYTNAFLDAIDATRKAAIGLLPLDAG